MAAVTPVDTRRAFPPRMPFVIVADRASQLEIDGIDGILTLERALQLAEKTQRVLDDSVKAAMRLSDAYDEAAPSVDELAIPIEAPPLLPGQRALRDIVDLAFMCAWSQQRKRASLLQAMASEDAWRVMQECSSAKRAVLRAATAIEQAIAAAARVPSELGQLGATSLDSALRTRALYRAFRVEIRPDATPDEGTIEARLRAAAIALGKVCSERFEGELRLQDRALFRQRRRDVATWMSRRWHDGATPALAADGVHLWRDIGAFAECLRMINLRPELRDHDDRVARASLDALAHLDDRAPLAPSVLEALGALLGRDDALDELLLRGHGAVGDLRNAIERLG